MKRHPVFFVTAIIFVALALFGISRRGSYTDITAEENYLDRLQVGELPERLAISNCKEMEQALPGAPFILRVMVKEAIEYLPGTGRQRVEVQKVYKGSGLETGQEIYIFSRQWSLCLDGNIDSVECGFVNIMDVGSEYLIFASSQVDALDKTDPVFQLYDEAVIVPVFCCEERTNVIAPVGEEHTYVPYSEVKENEFFAVSEAGLLAWEELKAKMLSAYP